MEETIANRLRAEIARCGLSLSDISRQTGIDVGHLHRFLHGKVGVGMERAQALADLFDLVLVHRSEVKQSKARKAKRKK